MIIIISEIIAYKSPYIFLRLKKPLGISSRMEIEIIMVAENAKHIPIKLLVFLGFMYINIQPIKVDKPAIKLIINGIKILLFML